ncbi:hypothetical protein ADICYQ_0214 [Cyclobacterium qasimii M12-11B]|uniref:Uncharacterized protein n=1 Tax=Cyclobacterium qasimii M12-11B TaxID=641524 RepID=S7VNI5_9BACT|nr:hypothetical protein ADICYQ_0214 [Cyclobacterium qasimii M12-11B]
MVHPAFDDHFQKNQQLFHKCIEIPFWVKINFALGDED